MLLIYLFRTVSIDPKYAKFAGDLTVKSNMLCNGSNSLGPREICKTKLKLN